MTAPSEYGHPQDQDAILGHETGTDGASKLKGLVWVFGCVGIATAFAVGLGPLARAVPWSWEQKLAGAVEPVPATRGCRAAPGADEALQKLVTRLYPAQPDDGAFSVDVKVVKNPVVNAYAELGGHITLYSGLLQQAESPEEVAGVLAHEMEHVHRRHIMQGTILHLFTAAGFQIVFSGDPDASTDWANYFLNMTFTRQQEAEADEGGLLRLQKTHIDNAGFKHFFQRMEENTSMAETFLSDHPSSESRADLVDEFKNDKTTPIMTTQEWAALRHYCK